MNFKILLLIFFIFILSSCEQLPKQKKINLDFEEKYFNSGFALIYNENLKGIKKLDDRSLNIYHKSLKKRSIVKISNPTNGKYLIAEVKSNKIKFSNFYNSILSLRIVEELELDFDEPYIQIVLISKNSTFVAKKAKMFEEERSVAEKAPVDGIQINDLKLKKSKIKKINKKKDFDYLIKVADFYYEDTAKMMINRIKTEALINNLIVKKLSKNKYRVLIGPFNDIKSLKNSFEKMNTLNFENLEILKNV